MSSHIAGTLRTCHHSQFIDSDGGLTNFLPRLASNYNHTDLHLPSSWDYTHGPLRLASHPSFELTSLLHSFVYFNPLKLFGISTISIYFPLIFEEL
jgi:hypothetical protein